MNPEQRRTHHLRESGQAAVESALTLPLAIFMFLGLLQLSMMLQGRILAHYAVFRAVRAGSVNHGNCTAMMHSALATLLPTITRTDDPNRLATAFRDRAINRPYKFDPALDTGFSGDILWIFRESPLAGSFASPQDIDFDNAQGTPMRLEARLIYWFPMKIPFANWVMTKMYRAHFGLTYSLRANPLLLVQKNPNWAMNPATLGDARILGAFDRRTRRGEFVFPIVASYTMRMMTPAETRYFATQNCPPTPP